uniref:Helicase ATP-binding domain-containing protein n=1 Tax=Chromera velia CCMP2878 TaxID=1169474 RepID=A0A0G4GKX8_9ALVE|eukprot:Cvel_22367.t1-p1 / transcript=Cvel_22367.t1 / gene=Cvel_22367 / organism=Chromera_velia_CCMP2878 / gene_product=Endoribonuclease Dicer homolog 2a, putative / transcript_product=Endoribonuclease Dicer homolog 2a, putative / location=Cvel_scaffold2191:24603-28424(+) / protein_length=770 / sequence_SO=supercontig / SO=protein_coding / is_pseudo=false
MTFHQPRPYQETAIRHAVSKNTIVHLPTGTGKTLVAARVIDHFVNTAPRKKALFIVPTRALVKQQARSCREQCMRTPPPRVIELCGSKADDLDGSQWRSIMDQNEVLVGTAEIFRKALVGRGFVACDEFSLVIFDECHNAVGGSPMASLMRDAFNKKAHTARVLGLTASFINGSIKNPEKKREGMEGLLQATIISPLGENATNSSFQSREFINVTFELPSEKETEEADRLEGLLVAQFAQVGGLFRMQLEDWKKQAKTGSTILLECGDQAMRFWAQEGIFRSLIARAEELGNVSSDPDRVRLSLSLKRGVERLKRTFFLKEVVGGGQGGDGNVRKPFSGKCERLLELLASLRLKSLRGGGRPFRGLVFVERNSMVYPLCHVLNSALRVVFSGSESKECREKVDDCESAGQGAHFEAEKEDVGEVLSQDLLDRLVRETKDALAVSEALGGEDCEVLTRWQYALPVSGVGSMKDREREAHLREFREGRVPLLVCTAAVEEGLDVAECAFVVRFSQFQTTKAHIQGSGRARKADAEVFYFCNDPAKEESKAAELRRVAADDRLALSESDQRKRKEEMEQHAEEPEIPHPFRPGTSKQPNEDVVGIANAAIAASAGELNFFNCLPALYEYAQAVFKSPFRPDDCLWEFEFVPSQITGSPDIKLPCTLSIPTDTGWKEMKKEEMREFWGTRSLEDVIRPAERLKNVKTQDRMKRQFAYKACIDLYKSNLMNSAFKATKHAKEKVRDVCDPPQFLEKLRVKSSFTDAALTDKITGS